jgi:hypothetical protein
MFYLAAPRNYIVPGKLVIYTASIRIAVHLRLASISFAFRLTADYA